jgi:hypothetical protein
MRLAPRSIFASALPQDESGHRPIGSELKSDARESVARSANQAKDFGRRDGASKSRLSKINFSVPSPAHRLATACALGAWRFDSVNDRVGQRAANVAVYAYA